MNTICPKCKRPLDNEIFSIRNKKKEIVLVSKEYYLWFCRNKKCKWSKAK